MAHDLRQELAIGSKCPALRLEELARHWPVTQEIRQALGQIRREVPRVLADGAAESGELALQVRADSCRRFDRHQRRTVLANSGERCLPVITMNRRRT